MSSFKLNINREVLISAAQPAFKAKVRDLNDEFQITLASPVFAWGRTTKRRNGSIVGNPRDAIDLGGLRDGQSYSFISPTQAKIEWSAPYTEKVFDHATVDLVSFTVGRLD